MTAYPGPAATKISAVIVAVSAATPARIQMTPPAARRRQSQAARHPNPVTSVSMVASAAIASGITGRARKPEGKRREAGPGKEPDEEVAEVGEDRGVVVNVQPLEPSDVLPDQVLLHPGPPHRVDAAGPEDRDMPGNRDRQEERGAEPS